MIMENFSTLDEITNKGVGLLERQSVPLHNSHTAWQYTYLPFKRILSIVLSLAGLIISAPLILIVAIAIKLDSEGPVFYNQVRIGKNGKPFVMYKFRSMFVDADKQIEELYEKNEMEGVLFKMKDDPRITKVGRWIRKTSIDELPQFLNILLGQMTVVGPRPILPNEYAACSQKQRTASIVTPGLTCYWQINGRNDITSFDERIRLDIKYVEDMGPMTDLLLLIKTIPVVITGKGAY
jgi:lipopolysaccharide/colanic/teichoic acid biosynthesis glycosyltransferase